ncbi:flagellar basal body rod protein FlgB [soil metagenome]
MIGKLDDALRFNEAALSLRGQRQQLLASNIANADTPNYKARDIDFTKALNGAMNRAEQAKSVVPAPNPLPNQLVKTDTAHLTGKSNGSTLATEPLLYRNAVQGNVDGNTVDMDVERNQFADNALRYEAGITFISGQIKSLLSAIQGQ